MSKYKPVLNALAAIILWLASLLLGLLDIGYSRQIIEAIYARFWPNQYWSAVFVENLVTVIFALGLIAFLIVTGEYHQKHNGRQESWKLYGKTLGVEILIPIMAFLLG
jgi:hypothetical protein